MANRYESTAAVARSHARDSCTSSVASVMPSALLRESTETYVMALLVDREEAGVRGRRDGQAVEPDARPEGDRLGDGVRCHRERAVKPDRLAADGVEVRGRPE